MFRLIMNAIFRQRKVRVFEVRRMPVGLELDGGLRWIGQDSTARLSAERKAAR